MDDSDTMTTEATEIPSPINEMTAKNLVMDAARDPNWRQCPHGGLYQPHLHPVFDRKSHGFIRGQKLTNQILSQVKNLLSSYRHTRAPLTVAGLTASKSIIGLIKEWRTEGVENITIDKQYWGGNYKFDFTNVRLYGPITIDDIESHIYHPYPAQYKQKQNRNRIQNMTSILWVDNITDEMFDIMADTVELNEHHARIAGIRSHASHMNKNIQQFKRFAGLVQAHDDELATLRTLTRHLPDEDSVPEALAWLEQRVHDFKTQANRSLGKIRNTRYHAEIAIQQVKDSGIEYHKGTLDLPDFRHDVFTIDEEE